MIQNRVKENLQACGVGDGHSILVALSGGADSMALLHLLLELGYSCSAAHCNFHLRGSESDKDEQFVIDYCADKNIPLYTEHFNTEVEARKNRISIEMAARNLRYQWFDELLKKENLDWLATGHHGDDMIETFFLNLARGSGLKGLRGIRKKSGYLIRPLLAFRRKELEAYCAQKNIAFRTDSSNSDIAIKRNNIRSNIIPVMETLNPSFFNTMIRNFKNLDEVWQIFIKEVDSVKKSIVAQEKDQMLIPVKLLKEHPQCRAVLFEILRPFNFNGEVVDDVIESLEGIPGKQFFSSTHRLVRDRFNLVLVPLEDDNKETYYIESETKQITEPVSLTLTTFKREDDFKLSRSPHCVHLDADLVEYPLKLRHWTEGDYFRPLGMEQFKKVSDFFVDEKFSLIAKEKTWLLLSGDDIIWVMGYRIDDRFKVTTSTRNILELIIKTD